MSEAASASFAGISTAELERSLATIRKGGSSSSDDGKSHIGQHLVKSLPIKSPYVFYNWAGTFTCTPASVYYPTEELQIRQLVELAKREKRCLRAFGAGHSPSDLACVGKEDWMVQMDGLKKVLKIDQEKKQITVQGGIRLRDLHPILAEHGLALSSLGSISDQSLAGAISTATHGSSYKYGCLSSTIRELTIVTAQEDSPAVTCSDSVNPDLFKASLCALGLTGIITSLTVQCEAAFKLEEEEFCMTTSDFVRSLSNDGITGLPVTAEHVRAWWFPQAGEVKVSRCNRTTSAVTIDKKPSLWLRTMSWFQGRVLGYHWHQLGLLVGRIYPNFLTLHAKFLYFYTIRTGCFFDYTPRVPAGQRTEKRTITDEAEQEPDPSYPRCTPTTRRVGKSVAIFNYDCLFPQYTYEGVVPIENTQAALKEMQVWLEGELRTSGGMRHHFPIEVRFTEEDDIWLSPTYKKRGCYIGIVQYKPYGQPVTYRALFERFEAIIFKHGGRPHWAKLHSAGPEKLAELYPKLGDFMAVREKVDPERVFVNPYTRRHFFGENSEQTDPVTFKTSLQRIEDKLKLT